MATGAIVARILTQYSDKGSKAATRDVMKLGKSFDNFSRKSARAFGIATAASAAFAVKIGKDAVRAALEDQKSQVLLVNSLRNTTNATDKAIAGTEAFISGLQKQFSVLDDDLRPAFGRLAALTGNLYSAQSLLGTALDVSAQSGVDLATSTGALIKASKGQYKGLQTLVPSLSTATVKSKDFAAALDEVGKATAGAASKRAQTLEFRLLGLRIAFGEVLETLGYALLPVMERFATALQTKIIPQFEKFVILNQGKLAAGFKMAAEFGIKFLAVAFAFSDWIVNNMGLIKGVAILIGGMFAVGKIAAFVTAIQSIVAAMALLRATSLGAAVALAFATGGASAIAGAVGAAVATAAVTGIALNTISNQNAKKNAAKPKSSADASLGYLFRPDAVKTIGTGSGISGANSALLDFIKGLNSATASTKTAKTLQDKITAEAVKQNLARQAALSGSANTALGGTGSYAYGAQKFMATSPTIAMGSSGSIGSTATASTNVVVNVQGSVSTNEDLQQAMVNALTKAQRRNNGVDLYAPGKYNFYG
jgi:hypothetical protein